MNKFFIPLILALVLFPAAAFAQSADATALTITPPFFQLNVNPGDSWSSAIKVVNTNPGDLMVHAELMGFGASDDQGHGNFIPLSDLSGDADALANWITVTSSSIDVPSGRASDVPFSINVPRDAAPGGHYAAILIGTGSAKGATGTSQVGVSSFISALIFVRVAGDVKESAAIQQFSTDQSSYQVPDVHFSVRVNNNGNVHVRPVGTIEIYNMFGKKRGEISINATGTLGYVLPSSTREFDAEWQGEQSLFDIGPYTAVVSIAYGDDGTKSISQTIGFWVLPIDQILEVLAAVLIGGFLVTSIIRRSVRKMLAREMSKYDSAPEPRSPQRKKKDIPPAHGVIDLRNEKKE